MSKDVWVIGVLRDIGKFANKRGYVRLLSSMDAATDAFLKDLADLDEDGANDPLDDEERAMREALAKLRNRTEN